MFRKKLFSFIASMCYLIYFARMINFISLNRIMDIVYAFAYLSIILVLFFDMLDDRIVKYGLPVSLVAFCIYRFPTSLTFSSVTGILAYVIMLFMSLYPKFNQKIFFLPAILAFLSQVEITFFYLDIMFHTNFIDAFEFLPGLFANLLVFVGVLFICLSLKDVKMDSKIPVGGADSLKKAAELLRNGKMSQDEFNEIKNSIISK